MGHIFLQFIHSFFSRSSPHSSLDRKIEVKRFRETLTKMEMNSSPVQTNVWHDATTWPIRKKLKNMLPSGDDFSTSWYEPNILAKSLSQKIWSGSPISLFLPSFLLSFFLSISSFCSFYGRAGNKEDVDNKNSNSYNSNNSNNKKRKQICFIAILLFFFLLLFICLHLLLLYVYCLYACPHCEWNENGCTCRKESVPFWFVHAAASISVHVWSLNKNASKQNVKNIGTTSNELKSFFEFLRSRWVEYWVRIPKSIHFYLLNIYIVLS